MVAAFRIIMYALAFGILFVAGAMLYSAAGHLSHQEASMLGLSAGLAGPWIGALIAMASEEN
jgi:NADH:ubiquinone oxidoreductase subunit 6 (subunit J)